MDGQHVRNNNVIAYRRHSDGRNSYNVAPRRPSQSDSHSGNSLDGQSMASKDARSAKTQKVSRPSFHGDNRGFDGGSVGVVAPNHSLTHSVPEQRGTKRPSVSSLSGRSRVITTSNAWELRRHKRLATRPMLNEQTTAPTTSRGISRMAVSTNMQGRSQTEAAPESFPKTGDTLEEAIELEESDDDEEMEVWTYSDVQGHNPSTEESQSGVSQPNNTHQPAAKEKLSSRPHQNQSNGKQSDESERISFEQPMTPPVVSDDSSGSPESSGSEEPMADENESDDEVEVLAGPPDTQRPGFAPGPSRSQNTNKAKDVGRTGTLEANNNHEQPPFGRGDHLQARKSSPSSVASRNNETSGNCITLDGSSDEEDDKGIDRNVALADSKMPAISDAAVSRDAIFNGRVQQISRVARRAQNKGGESKAAFHASNGAAYALAREIPKQPEIIDILCSDDEEDYGVDTNIHDDNEDRKLPAREHGHLGELPPHQGLGGDYLHEVDLSIGSAVGTTTAGVAPVASLPTEATSCSEDYQSVDRAVEENYDTFKNQNHQNPKPYTLEGFKELVKLFEKKRGETLEEIEDTKTVRASNRNSHQQYGRILPGAMDKIFKLMGMTKDGKGIFVDIGHGLGMPCFQAAYTFGTEARGIELDEGRNNLALHIMDGFSDIHRDTDKSGFEPARIDLKQGDFSSRAHRKWLIEADYAFCNNYDGVFSQRSGTHGKRNLDDHLARVFASMKEGAKLVTMYEIQTSLRCLPLKDSKEQRKRRGLRDAESDASSFYEVTKVNLGGLKDVSSWAQSNPDDTFCYIYTRVNQSADGYARFMCNNEDCPNAMNGVVMKVVQGGDPNISSCKCKINDRTRRLGRTTVNYKD
ncbi:lysine N-methyltransferase, H3 lysine-79 specific [Seminavis robusta]|uniref:Lysine N-methyltransferase, H3 lysine-79 specific n=1 Tax=Seminavis robusta TaxID=568900 RepID=A0A9N8HGS8_9STRA|nr:lysine N-methyltransferase, H3 lysine-79 specific [Seminavis robusta]|eukprot:Sro411_g137680.1 lysine N-methyltransferase, H3 lysine-79 specific (865) ;mRNA; r:37684-40367